VEVSSQRNLLSGSGRRNHRRLTVVAHASLERLETQGHGDCLELCPKAAAVGNSAAEHSSGFRIDSAGQLLYPEIALAASRRGEVKVTE
jgi:hypothetical protein